MATQTKPAPDAATDKPPRRQRWIPLSLRMFVTTLVLIAVGSMLWVGVPAYRQDAAIQEIESRGGQALPDIRGREWIRSVIGDRLVKATGHVEVALLRGEHITDEDLICLRQLPEITQLFIFRASITERGVQTIASLPNCDYLGLNGSTITDSGLEHLKGMKKLRVLFLSATPVTDAGLTHLRSLPRLEYLSLQESSVTDAGLTHLAAIVTLTTLDLSDTRVTDAGVSDLQRALPRLSIIR